MLLVTKPIVCFAEAATKPASTQVTTDLSTPRAAYNTAALSLRDGDMATFLAMSDVESPLGRVMMDWFVAHARFRTAATSRFGQQIVAEIDNKMAIGTPQRYGEQLLEQAKKRDELPLTVNGDRAVVGDLSLKKKKDSWRLILYPKTDEPENLDYADLYRAATKRFDQCARGIESGRIADREQVLRAIGLGEN